MKKLLITALLISVASTACAVYIDADLAKKRNNERFAKISMYLDSLTPHDGYIAGMVDDGYGFPNEEKIKEAQDIRGTIGVLLEKLEALHDEAIRNDLGEWAEEK